MSNKTVGSHASVYHQASPHTKADNLSHSYSQHLYASLGYYGFAPQDIIYKATDVLSVGIEHSKLPSKLS